MGIGDFPWIVEDDDDLYETKKWEMNIYPLKRDWKFGNRHTTTTLNKDLTKFFSKYYRMSSNISRRPIKAYSQ